MNNVRLPISQNVSTTQVSSEQCQVCHNPPTTTNFVKCNTCRLPFHIECIKISNSEAPWICSKCSIQYSTLDSPTSVCSHRSLASNSSKLSNTGRLSLELKRLEEERQLERRYIQRKYQILEQSQADIGDTASVMDSIHHWLNDHPEPNAPFQVPTTLCENNNHDNSATNQTFTTMPTSAQNITSKAMRSTMIQPNLMSFTNSNNNVQQQNPNTLYNNPYSAQPQSNTQPNPYAQMQYSDPTFYIPPHFTGNSIVNSTRRDLTQQELNARHTVPKELPLFTGNPEEYPLFSATYDWSTTVCGLTDAENLVRLQKSLRGDALKAVQHILIHPSCVPAAISTLKLLFGQPEKIFNALKNKIKLLPSINTNKLETITFFAVEVKGLKTMIEACGLYEELNNSSLLQDLILKMPPSLQLNWGTYKIKLMNENKKANLSEFCNWIYDIGISASSVNFENGSTISASTDHVGKSKQKNEYLHTHLEQREKTCIVCDKHCKNVSVCQKFLASDRNERWNIVRRCSLCKLCLRKHYGVCKSNIVCGRDNCQTRHNSLLHSYQNNNKEITNEGEMSNDDKNDNQTHNVNTHSGSFNQILFKIIPIKIYGKNNKFIKTFAFIDEGSSVSLMDDNILRALDLDGEMEPLCLRWTSSMERNEQTSKSLTISLSGQNVKRHKIKVRTVQHLSLPSQTINYEKLSSQFQHLKGLPIKNYIDAVPSVLIGLDNISLCTPNRIREGRIGEPTAICTRLGWILCGNMLGKPNEKIYTCHVCECNETDSVLNNLVRQFYALEAVGISGAPNLIGKENQRAMSLLKKYTIQKPNGHYESSLLWKYEDINLPPSYDMAKKRLVCLEKILKNNVDLLTIFKKTIAEYSEKNYISKVEGCKIDEKKCWYLPIFPVFNKNKPNKTRIVWDAAAKAHGISLNSMLLKGPDLLTSLPAILFRFRQKHFAVTADIEQMFHRIFVRKEDRNAQRFLWRDCDTSKDPEIYVMNVLIFGASCAPCVSQYVKNEHAAKYENTYPEAVAAIKNSHYVDDFLWSTDSPEEAIKLASEVHFIHSQAGFNLRNWRSNSQSVLNGLSTNSVDNKCLNIIDSLEPEKVLGIFWKSSDDTIIFKISSSILESPIFLGIKDPTKREILKILMSVYDPLGLVGNFIMHLKITLQEIWRSGVGWDDPVLGPQAERWKKWLMFLPSLQEFKIPRCYLQSIPNFKNASVDLHTFVDASENGYAAVSYFRITSGNEIIVSLVGSKTRVAPLKLASIPRLELMAALIGARFSKAIICSHDIKVRRKFFWSDSRTVLSWISSDHRKYHQFVAVRVSEILDISEIGEWRWIAGRLNVADEATKWSSSPNLSESGRWLSGPDFLKHSEDKWLIDGSAILPTDVEIKHSSLVIQQTDTLISIKRFSQWCRLLRAVAFVIKFCNLIQNKTHIKDVLTQDELYAAELLLLKEAQIEYFANEIKILRQKQSLPKSSSIYKLSPFIHCDGVLRVSGRVHEANVPEEMKSPAILPKQSYLTRLIILHYHNKFHHTNHETAVNEIRQKYYIPRLRTVFKSVMKCCQMCKIRKAVPSIPQMAKLPRARVSSFIAPFTFTGIDYFGPLFVTVNRHKEKRYGALFTCLTIRAVHVEIVNSLTTSSCIMAIRNFVARRGAPQEFFSDNGTNFIGAERELREAFQEVDTNELIRCFTTSRMKWNFNPPSAPHMGGAWERLVRSVKSVLYKIMPERCPHEEILRSMMTEVENIINSRPLTYVPIEHENMEALTPNHFLLGSSNGLKPLALYDDSSVVLRQCWLSSQQFAEKFWKRWVAEYLPTLTCRTKWFEKVRPLEVGDLVVVIDPSSPRNVWPRGKIIEIFKASDGQVRKAKLMTTCGVLERPAAKLAVLDVAQNLE